jgi:hypothetical protein
LTVAKTQFHLNPLDCIHLHRNKKTCHLAFPNRVTAPAVSLSFHDHVTPPPAARIAVGVETDAVDEKMLVEAGRVFLFAFAASAAKTWRFDSDIANPANWEGAAGCRGVHFAAHNTAPVYIKELTAAEITLPGDGQIGILDGGFIEFKDNKKCEFCQWVVWVARIDS